MFPAETQTQALWTDRFLVCVPTLSQFIVFSAAAAVLLLSSVTWSLPALLLPPLVEPFHALIPAVLSEVVNHTCTSESLLTNEVSAPNTAMLLIEEQSYNSPVDSSVTTVLRNSSKDPTEGECSVSQAREESSPCELPHSNALSAPAASPEMAASLEAILHPDRINFPGTEVLRNVHFSLLLPLCFLAEGSL